MKRKKVASKNASGPYYVVQYRCPVTRRWVTSLTGQGVSRRYCEGYMQAKTEWYPCPPHQLVKKDAYAGNVIEVLREHPGNGSPKLN